jgi:ABC-type sulfate transport system substrate-binding protein
MQSWSIGTVDSNWDQNSYNGFVQDSVVVFVVRQNNKEHPGLGDLSEPGCRC